MFSGAIRKFNKDYSNLVSIRSLGQECPIRASKALRSCEAPGGLHRVAGCASACLLRPASLDANRCPDNTAAS